MRNVRKLQTTSTTHFRFGGRYANRGVKALRDKRPQRGLHPPDRSEKQGPRAQSLRWPKGSLRVVLPTHARTHRQLASTSRASTLRSPPFVHSVFAQRKSFSCGEAGNDPGERWRRAGIRHSFGLPGIGCRSLAVCAQNDALSVSKERVYLGAEPRCDLKRAREGRLRERKLKQRSERQRPCKQRDSEAK